MSLNQLTNNLTGKARYEMLDGVEYVACPVAMITPGVLNGSNGPLFYPAEECSKTPQTWNHKPVVVYHPEINGKGVSACDKDILERQSVGIIMNAKFSKGKLRGEAWINPLKANKVDTRIMEAVEKGVMMEVSTGVFTDNEDAGDDAVYNGVPYDAIARNYRADHLALLPDQIGACSIADGAGLLQVNALSHDDIRSSLYADLRERFGTDAWIVDVFPTAIVYERGNKLWKLTYTKTGDVAKLTEDNPVQVKRNVQYRTIDGALVGNAVYSSTQEGESEMAKKEIVSGLIANAATQWTEEHREQLMGLPEATLKLMEPVANTEDEPEKKGKAKAEEVEGEGEPVPAANAAKASGKAAPVTLDQLPPEVRAVYNHGLATLNKQKKNAIDKIVANGSNRFNREALEQMDIDMLEGMADLCNNTTAGAPAAPAKKPPLFVSGSAPTENAGATDAPKPLGLPTMNWGNENAK